MTIVEAVTAPKTPAPPRLGDNLEATSDPDRVGDGEEWWQLDVTDVEAADTSAAGFSIEQCRLGRVDFSAGAWQRASVRDVAARDGNWANLHTEDSTLERVALSTTRATGLQWTNGLVRDVTVTDSRVDLAGFRFSKLRDVEFRDCKLAGLDLTEAALTRVRFVDCDLSGAKLHHATMSQVAFDDCVLDDIDGIEALRGATITAADLMPLLDALARALGITVRQVD